MKYPATLNHDVGILQQVLRVDGPEVPLAAPEHHGHDIHRDLVDQPQGQRLPAHGRPVAGLFTQACCWPC
jgi:hypothetical protein